jgi:hypothetical protein
MRLDDARHDTAVFGNTCYLDPKVKHQGSRHPKLASLDPNRGPVLLQRSVLTTEPALSLLDNTNIIIHQCKISSYYTVITGAWLKQSGKQVMFNDVNRGAHGSIPPGVGEVGGQYFVIEARTWRPICDGEQRPLKVCLRGGGLLVYL